MSHQVTVLKMGQCDVPGPEVYWMSHWGGWETLYFYMVVIRGEGKTLVVNTGPPADLSLLNSFWGATFGERGEMVRHDDERPENALRNLGVRAEEVNYVLITPLQSYATANIPLFSNAQICISRRGWIEDFHAPGYPIHQPRKLRLPDDVLIHLMVTASDRLKLVDDEEEVVPGVRAFWAGVHHRSSMAYCIDTVKGTVIVSDCFFKYPNIEENKPLGILESMSECYSTYARIRAEGDILVPLYDPAVLQRFPGGQIV
jgi:glyoxylase-like metal-dependent hydrolase (beta-lactamase superfamily II)